MIAPVNELAKSFADAGADLISFHLRLLMMCLRQSILLSNVDIRWYRNQSRHISICVTRHYWRNRSYHVNECLSWIWWSREFIEDTIEKISEAKILLIKQDHQIFHGS